jgi:hypothetical protein
MTKAVLRVLFLNQALSQSVLMLATGHLTDQECSPTVVRLTSTMPSLLLVIKLMESGLLEILGVLHGETVDISDLPLVILAVSSLTLLFPTSLDHLHKKNYSQIYITLRKICIISFSTNFIFLIHIFIPLVAFIKNFILCR